SHFHGQTGHRHGRPGFVGDAIHQKGAQESGKEHRLGTQQDQHPQTRIVQRRTTTVVIITVAVAIAIIGWLRGKRGWPLRTWTHLDRVINQTLKCCRYGWNLGHGITSYRVSKRVRASINKSTKITIRMVTTRRFCCRTSSRRTRYPLLQRGYLMPHWWHFIERHEQERQGQIDE